MTRAALLLLTLASAGPCIAQAPVLVFNRPASSCPIGIQAQPTPGLTQMVVHGTPPSRDYSNRTDYPSQQSLRFLLTNPRALGITAIEVTAHGLRPGGYLEPTSSITGGPISGPTSGQDKLDKHVTLQLAVAPGKRASSDVRFDGFTSIRSLDLESVTYADGSAWHATAARTCHFEPSRLMLVAGN